MPEWMERNGRYVAVAFVLVYLGLFAFVGLLIHSVM